MSPKLGRRVHLSMLLLWLLAGIPASWFLRNSVAWVTFLSAYAIIVSHWAGWSAERPTEVAEESP